MKKLLLISMGLLLTNNIAFPYTCEGEDTFENKYKFEYVLGENTGILYDHEGPMTMECVSESNQSRKKADIHCIGTRKYEDESGQDIDFYTLISFIDKGKARLGLQFHHKPGMYSTILKCAN